ncbi:MAG: type IV pilin N-terminal domain-containing protein [Methanoregulaceae archaeon]
MNPKEHNEPGVSEVVGEMLMIALVVVLLAVFSAALFNYLPVDREPTVSIMMKNDTRGNITLWHKGGDWVKGEDLSVLIGYDTDKRRSYKYNDTFTDSSNHFLMVHPDQQKKKIFDLGSNITVIIPESIWNSEYLQGNITVRLVSPRSVIYTGRIAP